MSAKTYLTEEEVHEAFLTIAELAIMLGKNDPNNWGVCTYGKYIWFGKNDHDNILTIPLSEILRIANESFPDESPFSIHVACFLDVEKKTVDVDVFPFKGGKLDGGEKEPRMYMN